MFALYGGCCSEKVFVISYQRALLIRKNKFSTYAADVFFGKVFIERFQQLLNCQAD